MHVSQFIEQNYPEYYSWNSYPADKTAAFSKIKDEWGIFSNFTHTPLTVGGVTFDCAERLFQVMKFSDTGARRAVMSFPAGTGMKMKMKPLEKNPGARTEWGKVIVDVLKYCLMLKYEQSPEFRSELERSKGMYIVEDQSAFSKKADTYGAKLTADGSEYSGPNLMGRLLMELRDNGRLEYSLPESLTDFSDLAIPSTTPS